MVQIQRFSDFLIFWKLEGARSDGSDGMLYSQFPTRKYFIKQTSDF